MSAPKYKPGDRVIGTVFLLRGKAGKIEKPAKTSALVLWDGRNQPERVSINSIEPETAEHVATRRRAAEMKAWRERKPSTTFARVAFSRFGFNADESGAELHLAKTPDEMRTAAAELLQLADWFAERPVKHDQR